MNPPAGELPAVGGWASGAFRTGKAKVEASALRREHSLHIAPLPAPRRIPNPRLDFPVNNAGTASSGRDRRQPRWPLPEPACGTPGQAKGLTVTNGEQDR